MKWFNRCQHEFKVVGVYNNRNGFGEEMSSVHALCFKCDKKIDHYFSIVVKPAVVKEYIKSKGWAYADPYVEG